MTLPLSRFALSLALAGMATLVVVAQTPDATPADSADAEEAVETTTDAAPPAEPAPPADATVVDAAADTSSEAAADAMAEPVAEAAVEAEAAPEVPADPTPPVVDESVVDEPVAEVTEAAKVAEVAELAAPVEQSVVVTPAEPAVATEVVVEAAPAPTTGPVCCPINVVDYRTTLSAKRAYRCYGPGVNTSVCVDNPADCTCTHYEVPLCVPACCTGAPRVCPSTGLLGRGKVDLVWDCGFTATVVFRAHGGAIVIYQG